MVRIFGTFVEIGFPFSSITFSKFRDLVLNKWFLALVVVFLLSPCRGAFELALVVAMVVVVGLLVVVAIGALVVVVLVVVVVVVGS